MCNRAELDRRIRAVASLLSLGKTREQIIEYADEQVWEVHERQVDTYIKQGTAYLRELGRADFEIERAKALLKLDGLYDNLLSDFSDKRSIKEVCADALTQDPDGKLEVLLRAVLSTYGRKYAAIEKAIKIIERRCKLLGLDAPTHVTLDIGSATQKIADFLKGWFQEKAVGGVVTVNLTDALREIATGLRAMVGLPAQGAMPDGVVDEVYEESDAST